MVFLGAECYDAILTIRGVIKKLSKHCYVVSQAEQYKPFIPKTIIKGGKGNVYEKTLYENIVIAPDSTSNEFWMC